MINVSFLCYFHPKQEYQESQIHENVTLVTF